MDEPTSAGFKFPKHKPLPNRFQSVRLRTTHRIQKIPAHTPAKATHIVINGEKKWVGEGGRFSLILLLISVSLRS